MRSIPSTQLRRATALFPPALLPALFLFVGGPASAQDPSLYVYTSTTATAFQQTDNPGPEALERAGSVSSNASANGQSGGLIGGAWSSAWGTVNTGYMQLRTFGGAQLTGGGLVGEVSTTAQANASLSDTFRITCPACVAGTEATVSFRVVAEGSAAADGSLLQTPDDRLGSVFTAYSAVSSSFQMFAPNANDPSEPAGTGMFLSTARWQSGGDYHDRPMWNGTITARFVMGDDLSFIWSAFLTGSATAGNYTDEGSMTASSFFNTDFSSSFYWGGISEVRDANGQLLTGITALNAAGVDYVNALAPPPVPEPATASLMLTGLLAVLAVALRLGRHGRR